MGVASFTGPEICRREFTATPTSRNRRVCLYLGNV
jgi:hypothetical protein